MPNMRITLFILTLILIFSGCTETDKVDFNKDLLKLSTERQKKLDTGIGMLQTERKFLAETDSMLSLIYNKTLENGIDTKTLKIEQKSFELKRKKVSDSLWLEVDKVFRETGMEPELDKIIAYGIVADLNFVRAMILNNELISK